MDWKAEAKRLRFEEGKSWAEITNQLRGCFPGLKDSQIREKIRGYIRGTPEYRHKDEQQTTVRSDGTIVSEKFIKLKEGRQLTPKELLVLHGLDPSKWQVVSCVNNFWNSQLTGGVLQVSYQSKLTAKPTNGIDLEQVDEHFAKLDRTYKPPARKIIHRDANCMAEVNIADLHLGKLCWRGDTGNNYDYKMARNVYLTILSEICEELSDKKLEYILFPFGNDFFNSDTIDKTTTAGTPQDTDVRWQKLFNVGVEMSVDGITMLSELAPVKVIYIPSNHDEMTGYHAIKYLEAWFRKDQNVEIDADPKARKYHLYGNTHIGFTHGSKEGRERASYEKASRLASVMPIESKQMWSQALFHEMHAAHLHSEQAIQEINGVMVRRISSPAATDTYHYESGYVGAVRKAQTFIYDKERGLKQIINTPVVEVGNGSRHTRKSI